MNIPDKSFFHEKDVLKISKKLLGMSIYTRIDGAITGGIITETEGYAGGSDKACHAYGYKLTKRTQTMFKEGGIAYIYLCYGIHHLLNIVTNTEGEPDAVLIRSFEPHTGIDTMMQRRKMTQLKRNISAGPGNVSSALGLTRKYDGEPVTGPVIWLENDEKSMTPRKNDIAESARIGVDYAEEYAKKPWRFYLINNDYVSKQTNITKNQT